MFSYRSSFVLGMSQFGWSMVKSWMIHGSLWFLSFSMLSGWWRFQTWLLCSMTHWNGRHPNWRSHISRFFYTTNQLLLMPKMSMQTHHHHQAGFVDLNVNEAPGRRINSAAARILRLPRTSNLRSLSRLHRKRRLTPNSDVVFIPKDWLHLGFLWCGCDIEYKIAWLNDSETWLSWLLLGPQNLNDHNFRENQQSPINLG